MRSGIIKILGAWVNKMKTVHITSRDNAAVKQMLQLRRDRKARRAAGLMFLEGEKMLREAARAGARIDTLFCTDALRAMDAAQGSTVHTLVRTPAHIIAALSGVETPTDFVFSCALPAPLQLDALAGRQYIVLENVQDPGNVGTVLRTADAFGIDGVLLAGSCADHTAPKVVRSTMGAIFRVPVACADIRTLAQVLGAAGIPLYGAALRPQAKTPAGLAFDRCAVLIGNEGAGLTDEALSLCGEVVFLPMRGAAESLNAAVAAAVFMWQMQQSR